MKPFSKFKRRKRDSNPRSREGQRFSRPSQSTTLPFLRGQIYGNGSFGKKKILKA